MGHTNITHKEARSVCSSTGYRLAELSQPAVFYARLLNDIHGDMIPQKVVIVGENGCVNIEVNSSTDYQLKNYSCCEPGSINHFICKRPGKSRKNIMCVPCNRTETEPKNLTTLYFHAFKQIKEFA